MAAYNLNWDINQIKVHFGEHKRFIGFVGFFFFYFF